MNDWEGKDRRIGRPPRAEEAATIRFTIRVTPAEKRALERMATRNRAESFADFCRLVLNEAAADTDDPPPFHPI